MPELEQKHIKAIMGLDNPQVPVDPDRQIIYDRVHEKLLSTANRHYEIWQRRLFPLMDDVTGLRKAIEWQAPFPIPSPTFSEAQENRLIAMLKRVEDRYPIPVELRGKVEPGIEIHLKPGTLKQDLENFCSSVADRPIQQFTLNYEDIGKLEVIPLHLRPKWINIQPILDFHDPFSATPKAIYTFDVTHSLGLSMKDIPAKMMVEESLKTGKLKPGQPISEKSSGNTGVGLALMGLHLGYKVILYTTDKSSQSKIDRLKLLDAHVVVVPEQAEFSASEYGSIGGSISRYVDKKLGCFYINQHGNINNANAHFKITGSYIPPDILDEITAFIAPVGTYGSFVGLGGFFENYMAMDRNRGRNIKRIGVDAEGGVIHQISPDERRTMTAAEIAEKAIPHGFQGFGGKEISEYFHPLLHLDTKFVAVTKDEAELCARVALPLLGILGGQSSGAVYSGIQTCLAEGTINQFDTVLAVFTDLGFPYADILYQSS